MSYISGQTTVTGSVTANVTTSLPQPATGQTHIKINGTGNASMQNAYTVTSGKTLYLFAGWAEGGNSFLQIYDNDGTTRNMYLGTLSGESPAFTSGNIPFAVYTSGQVVKVTMNNNFKYGLVGFEV